MTSPDPTMLLLATVVDGILPEGTGFAVFVFPSDTPELCNYVSNCDREDMRRAVREWFLRQQAANN